MFRSAQTRLRFPRFTSLFERLQELADFLMRRSQPAFESFNRRLNVERQSEKPRPTLRLLRLGHLEERIPAGALMTLHGFFLAEAAAAAALMSHSDESFKVATLSDHANVGHDKLGEGPQLLSIKDEEVTVGRVEVAALDDMSLDIAANDDYLGQTSASEQSGIASQGYSGLEGAKNDAGQSAPFQLESARGTGDALAAMTGLVNLSQGPSIPPSVPNGAAPQPSQPTSGFSFSSGPTQKSVFIPPLPDDIRVPCNIDYELASWNPYQFGGKVTGHGTVSLDGSNIVITEGNSFTVGIKRDLQIPASAESLRFEYAASFDTSAQGRMKDAFEVALVDQKGNTLAYTFVAPDRDAYFNHTEGLQPSYDKTKNGNTARVQVANKMVTLDLTQSDAPGQTATVIFRLVNNDGDTKSKVTIYGCDQPPIIAADLEVDTAPSNYPPQHEFQFDRLTSNSMIKGNVTDKKGVTELKAKLDNGSYATISFDTTTGNFSWDAKPSPGPHTVTFQGKNESGLTSEKTVTFEMNTPPVADAGADTTIFEGSEFKFDGTNSTVSKNLIRYSWKFPVSKDPPNYKVIESPTQSTAEFAFINDDATPYAVTLTVTDKAGQSSSDSVSVKVENLPPTLIDPGFDDNVEYWTHGTTSAGDFRPAFYVYDPGAADTMTMTVAWGDSTTATLTPTPFKGTLGALNPNWKYGGDKTYGSTAAAYTGTFTVSDGFDSDTQEFIATVNLPYQPIANQAAGYWEGDTFKLDLDSKGAFPGSNTSWTINWEDNSTSSGTLAADASTTVSHIYVDDGLYYATTKITDGTTEKTVTTNLYAFNAAPVVTVNPAQSTTTVNTDFSVTVSFDDAGKADSHTVTVNWGDGNTTALDPTVTSTSHKYGTAKTYIITATVKDGSKSGSWTTGNATAAVTITPSGNKSGGKGSSTNEWNQSIVVSATSTNPGQLQQLTNLTQPLIQFSNPAFSTPYTGDYFWFENAMIDWGDGSEPEEAKIQITEGEPGVPTIASVVSVTPHSFVFDGLVDPTKATVTVTIDDSDGKSYEGTFTVSFQGRTVGLSLVDSGEVETTDPPKFFVVDSNTNEVFRYKSSLDSLGAYALSPNVGEVVGVASNPEGTRQWIIDDNGRVFIHGPDGSYYGSWQAVGLTEPTDMTTNGIDVWIVDDSNDTVYRFAEAASIISGFVQPSDSFALRNGNDYPAGITTDGEMLWVVDNPGNNVPNEVWTYSVAGDSIGAWTLSNHNRDATGITLSFAEESQDLWVVDRTRQKVYYYAGAREWQSGEHTADNAFNLAATNENPSGIADPYNFLNDIELFTPTLIRADAGTPVLISGRATLEGDPARVVTINNQSADVIDSAGNFFAYVTIRPGEQSFTIRAFSTDNAMEGTDPDENGFDIRQINAFGRTGSLDEVDLSNVSTSVKVHYGTTSLDDRSGIVYADYALENLSQTALSTPLYVGVRHLSNPSIVVEGYSGRLADGTYYYDISSLVPRNNSLEGGEATTMARLQFSNPMRVSFTYDIVVFSKPNEAPLFISPPLIEAVAGRHYRYDLAVFDPEGEQDLKYSSVTGPFQDPHVPLLSWWPSVEDVGAHAVTLRVTDSHGAVGEQSFILNVRDPGTLINRPPIITSPPVVEARVSTPYKYHVVAFDPDSEPVHFELTDMADNLIGAMTIDEWTGLITWTPTAADSKDVQSVTIRAKDQAGLTAYQTYGIKVLPTMGNSPPVFVSTPNSELNISGGSFPLSGSVSPSVIEIPSAAVGDHSVSVSLKSAEGNDTISDMDVFILFDQDDELDANNEVWSSDILAEAFQYVLTGYYPNDPNEPGNYKGLSEHETLGSITFGFGVGRYQNYNVLNSDPTNASLPFLLNQPIVTEQSVISKANGWDFTSVLANAVRRPGFEDVKYQEPPPNSSLSPHVNITHSGVEALLQVATGKGLDVNQNQSTQDNGPAGSTTAQNMPLQVLTALNGSSLVYANSPSIANGDVPTFSSFIPSNELILPPPEGDIGGAGFRRHSLPLVIVLNNKRGGGDYTVFRDDSVDGVLTGKNSNTIAVTTAGGASTTAYFDQTHNSKTVDETEQYAGLQDTVDALNRIGAMVVEIDGRVDTGHVGTWGDQIGVFSTLTGATKIIESGVPSIPDTTVPLYYSYDYSGDVPSSAVNLGREIINAISQVKINGENRYDVEVISSDPTIQIKSDQSPQSATPLFNSTTATLDFDVTITSDGKPHAFDLLFVQSGTGNILGSIPVKINSAGYDYTALAVDPDGDSITYTLVAPLPPGVDADDLDPATGVLTWVPTDEDTYTFHVQADDGRGGFAVQDFSVDVSVGHDKNKAPEIQQPAMSTSHQASTSVGRFFQYQVVATDNDSIGNPSGDALRYYLVRPPSGMTINATTGLISWEPLPYQIGSRTVEIRVSDGWGGVDTVDFTIKVDERTTINHAPTFQKMLPYQEMVAKVDKYGLDSVPLFIADMSGKLQFVVTDEDGDLPTTNTAFPTFDLIVKPAGAGIDPQSGWFVWTPTLDQAGGHQVVVRARDNHGGARTHSFTIMVAPANLPPEITSTPITTFPTTGQPFEYRVRAQDPDVNDVLFYSLEGSLVGSGPNEMSIDSAGVFRWTPDGSQTSVGVTIVVRDRKSGGLTDTQPLTLQLQSTLARSPEINSHPREIIQAGQKYVYELNAIDRDGDPLAITVNVGATDAKFENGLLTWETKSTTQLKDYSFVITVDDDTNPDNSIDPTPAVTQTFNVTVIASATPNEPPEITSMAPVGARVGTTLEWTVEATDADGDAIRYEIIGAPHGVSFDSTYGTLRWTPTWDHVGVNDLRVKAFDPYGGSDEQIWLIKVSALNTPPRIVSVPVVDVGAGEPYIYAVSAVDKVTMKPNPDQAWVFVEDYSSGQGVVNSVTYVGDITWEENDVLTYSLVDSPAAMKISKTGVITWLPYVDPGIYEVNVKVSDAEFSVIQSFEVVVHELTYNRAPGIVSLPAFSAVAGRPYTYQVIANDPNGDEIVYSLGGSKPNGVEIDPSSGLLTWEPTEATDPNSPHVIQIIASDGKLNSYQNYLLHVRESNQQPEFWSTAPAKVLSGKAYHYQAIAIDPDGDPVTYSITEGALSGMSISKSGHFMWATTVPSVFMPEGALVYDKGKYPVTIAVTDPFGDPVYQSFDIEIFVDTTAPLVSIFTPNHTVPTSSPLQIQVNASDDVVVATRKLQYQYSTSSDWKTVQLSSDGWATIYAPTSAETITLKASATDGAGNTSSDVTATIQVYKAAPNDGLAPTVTLNAPTIPITAPTTIKVSVDESSSFNWSLSIAAVGSLDLKTIQSGFQTADLDNHEISLDPTLLPNGMYTLTLAANDGTHAATTSQVITIDGNLKVGHLTFSVVDMTVSASGVPITITRTYDSMRAFEDGPLGPGWRIEATAGKAQTDVAYELIPGAGMYPAFRDGNRITLTMPDGSTSGFTFYAQPAGFLSPEYRPTFTPDSGVRDKLIVDSSNTLMKLSQNTYQSAGVAYNPFNPVFGGALIVRTRSGQEYRYENNPTSPKGTAGKLVEMTDRHGNRLDFSDDGVESMVPTQVNGQTVMSAGKSVQFLWDASHKHIIGVKDPRGKQVIYTYEKYGDGTKSRLKTVTDREQNTTKLEYLHGKNPTFVTAVVDPLGNKSMQVTFDDNGRVDTLIDAAGNKADRNYEITESKRTESVTVGEGANASTTKAEYDTHGNVTRTESPSKAVTLMTYGTGDERYLPKVITQDNPDTTAFDVVNSLEYDNLGQVTATVNTTSSQAPNTPALRTEVTYGPFGQPTIITDPLNHITINTYESLTGDLLSTKSPEGVSSEFKYDIQGNVESVKRGDAVSLFDYDNFGQLLSQTSPTGVTTTTKYNSFANTRETTTTTVVASVTTTVTSITEYDNEDRVIKEKSIRGTNTITTTTDYDPLGRVEFTEDAHGNKSLSHYDARGLTVQTASPSSKDKHLVSRTVYDKLGRAEWTIDAVATDQFLPASNSTATLTLTAPGTNTIYDAEGRVTHTERYASVTIGLKNAANGSYTTEQLSKGVKLSTSETHYDDLGRVDWTKASVELASNPQVFTKTSNTFDELGRQTMTTTSVIKGTADPVVDTITKTGYDDAGRVIWTLSPSDVRTSDSIPLVQYVRTETEYDADGRAITTIAGSKNYALNGSATFAYDFAGSVTRTKYDTLGRKEQETDVLGRVTLYGQDDSGRLISVTQPEVVDPSDGKWKAPVTKYDYDASGNMTKITDALGRETTFEVNAFGQQIKRTLPHATTGKSGGDFEQKFFNRFGDLDHAIDFNGARVDYLYDYGPDSAPLTGGFGRLLQVIDHSSPTIPIEKYEYDPYGRRSKVTQANGDVYGYGYDDLGRLTRETSPSGTSIPLTINYGYDHNERHVRTWTGSAESVAISDIANGYDPFGRLTSVTVNKRGGTALTVPELTNYAHTPAGNVATITTSSDSVTIRESKYDYDPTRPWVTKLTHVDGDDVPLSQFQYQRAKDGQVTQVVESIKQPDTLFVATAARYAYDAVNRLTKEEVNTTADGGDYTTTFTLDLVGNRKEERTTKEVINNPAVTIETASIFDARDRLQVSYTPGGTDTVGNVTSALDPTFYQYDKNGQQTAQTTYAAEVGFDTIGMPVTPSTTAITSSQQTAWNLRGQISDVTVTTASTTKSVQYAYNPDGIRVREAVTADSVTTTTAHLVDSNNPTGYQQDLELFKNGALFETVISGLELLSRSGQDHDGSNWQNALVSFYLSDIHSGIRQRLAPSIGVIAAYRYSAFGTIASQTYLTNNIADDPNQHLYRGELTDSVTGAMYLRQRWYDLEAGRFRSVDPFAGRILEPGSLHDYVYANADGINQWDPTGKWGISTSISIGAIGGALGGFGYGAYLGYQKTGTLFSLKTLTYGLVGAAIGAAVGATAGAGGHYLYSLFSGVGAPISSTLYNDLFVLSHPSFAYPLAAGFILGLAVGIAAPDFPVPSTMLAMMGGTAIASNEALHGLLTSNSFRFRLPVQYRNAIFTNTLFKNVRGRPVTLQSVVRTGRLYGIVFAAGFGIGFTVGIGTRSLTDLAINGIERALGDRT